MFAHANLSPMRNCSARSRRIWRRRRAARRYRRTKAHEAPVVVGFREGEGVAGERRLGVFGQLAGKDRRFGDAVENMPAELFARLGHADDRLQCLAGVAHLGLACRAHRAERDHVDLSADPFGARDRLACQYAQDRLQAVVADVMQMVGLGRREQDTVDARSDDRGEARSAPGAERLQHLGQRVFQIVHRRGAGIERPERVDQHDLPVETSKVVAKERPRHIGLVGLVAPLHHRRQRAWRDFLTLVERQRREGQGGRPLEVARHEEAARRQARERVDVVARLAQVSGEEFGGGARRFLLGRGGGVEAGKKRAPGRGERRAGFCSARFDRLARPLGVGLVEQRQVEQPFAGIIDDVERQVRGLRAPGRRALEFYGQAQLGNAPGRLRPAPIRAAQGGQVFFIGESRHRVVGLRLEIGARDAPFAGSAQHRQLGRRRSGCRPAR